MKLSEHFSLEELTISGTAERLGIENTPSDNIVKNLRILASGLETVRFILGDLPIIITSGYRSKALNKAVGGSQNSFHMLGLAADLICPSFGSPLDICRKIADAGIGHDQIIHEGRWCHIGFPILGVAPRRDLLTAKFTAAGTVYTTGLSL